MMIEPSPEDFLKVFGGRFYVPVSRPIVGWAVTGWHHYDGEPESLSLRLSLGPRRDPVSMSASIDKLSPKSVVHELLFATSPHRPFRFPLTVEREMMRIAVDGRPRVFTGYHFNGHTAATARIRDVYVTAQCRTRLLTGLSLGVLEPDRLRGLVRQRRGELAG
jgi:hypothetical protein